MSYIETKYFPAPRATGSIALCKYGLFREWPQGTYAAKSGPEGVTKKTYNRWQFWLLESNYDEYRI